MQQLQKTIRKKKPGLDKKHEKHTNTIDMESRARVKTSKNKFDLLKYEIENTTTGE